MTVLGGNAAPQGESRRKAKEAKKKEKLGGELREMVWEDLAFPSFKDTQIQRHKSLVNNQELDFVRSTKLHIEAGSKIYKTLTT